MSSEDELEGSTDRFTSFTRSKRLSHGSHNSRSNETIVSYVTSRSSTLTVIVNSTDSGKLTTKLNSLEVSQYLERIALEGVLETGPNYRLN